MSAESHSRRRLRSIGAVLAGALAGIALSIGTDMAMRSAGLFPPLGEPMAGSLFLLATAYRSVYGVAGSFLTARLAPDRPMLHALVLGGLGLVACVAGVAVAWNRGPEFGPRWYPLALVALAMPQAWAGGKLRLMQLQAR